MQMPKFLVIRFIRSDKNEYNLVRTKFKKFINMSDKKNPSYSHHFAYSTCFVFFWLSVSKRLESEVLQSQSHSTKQLVSRFQRIISNDPSTDDVFIRPGVQRWKQFPIILLILWIYSFLLNSVTSISNQQ